MRFCHACRVVCVSRRCHVQIGLAYLAMEKYESARDAFQLSLKGMTQPLTHSRSALGLTISSRAVCARVRCVRVRVCACVCVCVCAP